MNSENTIIAPHLDYTEEIQGIITSKRSPAKIREKLLDYHDNDIAMAMSVLSREEREKLYKVLDTVLERKKSKK